MQPLTLAQIAVGRPLRPLFTYQVPEGLEGKLRLGQRLLVPFGRGSALGFYLGPGAAPQTAQGLRPITQLLENEPALPEDVVELVRFAADHYRYPLGEALRAALPPGFGQASVVELPAPPVLKFVVASVEAPTAKLGRARKQQAVLSYVLAVGGRASLEEVSFAVSGAREAVARLVERGLLSWQEVGVAADSTPVLAETPWALTPEQAAALEAVGSGLQTRTFQPFLLQGVTGSGKTEVYLRAAAEALAADRGVLVLVPEIALTPQLVGRFRNRFGARVALLHSALSDGERLREWHALRSGRARIAVGVRSAVFAPVKDLGLVVVDEEHEPSFKQEDKLRYQARDLAVVRAKHAGAVLVLGSATPSLESMLNAKRGRYALLRMAHRVASRPLPEVSLVDLRQTRPRQGALREAPPVLSPQAAEALAETLRAGQQAIVFIHRRGDRTFLVCAACGEAQRCRRCDVSMTQHRSPARLLCHYCGESRPATLECPDCSGTLLELGAGTQRVEHEIAEMFPQARIGRLDRDATTSGTRVTELLAAFARRELDVLVGTQMVAKGHDFPGVTLVLVVLADTLLLLPDFRAAERTFQLLTQVSGRAGRGEEAGRVLVQTYNPKTPCVGEVIRHNYDAFAEHELAWRQALGYPPFSRQVCIRVEGTDAKRVESFAQRLGAGLLGQLPASTRLIGPAPSPLARLRGKTRWQLLLQADRHATLRPLLLHAEALAAELPRSIHMTVDVDPATML
ncbi:MAG: primosomal protein N' [Myxococcaceae bacterium]